MALRHAGDPNITRLSTEVLQSIAQDTEAYPSQAQAMARELVELRALKVKVEAVLALRDPDAEYDIADIQEMLS